MQKKDERMKISSEILTGIKYVKMSGWEEPFLEKVNSFLLAIYIINYLNKIIPTTLPTHH